MQPDARHEKAPGWHPGAILRNMETAQGKANMITAAEVVVGDLIDDEDSDVRAAVAEYGTDAQR